MLLQFQTDCRNSVSEWDLLWKTQRNELYFRTPNYSLQFINSQTIYRYEHDSNLQFLTKKPPFISSSCTNRGKINTNHAVGQNEKKKKKENCTEEKSRFKRYLITPQWTQTLRFLAFPDSSNNEQTPHARREGKTKTKQKLHRKRNPDSNDT